MTMLGSLTEIPFELVDVDPLCVERSASRRRHEDFTGAIKRAIKSCLFDGCPSINLIARMTNVSVRTLQRKLARAGLTFLELRQQVRFEVAAQMLSDESTKIIDIAYELGYEDPSNFSRSFRHVAGASPRQFRAMNQTM